jgi:hypothetical protein
MALQIQGNAGTIAEVDGTIFRAMRVVARPLDYSTFGQYQTMQTTGTIAAGAAADSEILQMRWVDATRLCIIHQIMLEEFHSLTAFAVGFFRFSTWIARGWSADGGGGNQITLTGNNAKMRTNMGTSLFSTGARIATTGALTAGTKTFDAAPIHAVYGVANAVANTQYVPNTNLIGGGAGALLYDAETEGGSSPIVLATNEGISIRATVPATGTWVAAMRVRWSEVAAY